MTAATVEIVANLTLLTLLVGLAAAAVMVRDILVSVILLSVFSLAMAAQYLVLGAPDVAMTEAAVGAGFSTILLVGAVMLVGREEKVGGRSFLAPLVLVTATAGLLIYATLGMPAIGDPFAPANRHVAAYYIQWSHQETGIPNMVASVLASYRGYDTLGETVVIFTAVFSVILLLTRISVLRKLLDKKEEA